MEFASQIVGTVVDTLMANIIKHLGYVTSSNKHARNMRNRMKHLEGTSIDVKGHMDANNISNLEVPARVPGWLEDVDIINKEVKRISSNGGMGCFNIKKRHQTSIDAIEAYEKIEGLIREKSEIIWSDTRRPLGKINSIRSATLQSLSGGDTQSGFKSRDVTFNDALKNLQQNDDKTQVIALCGMGGVGKSTIMEQLKKVAEDKKMFDWIVKVVVGKNPNMYSIQNVIAVYTGEDLSEKTETVRADLLCKRFEKMSEDKKRILVILDDVWEKVELKDIGITTPLRKGFKLLLTSRDENVCKQIAVDADSVLAVVGVKVLAEAEARNLFSRITGISEDYDHSLFKIGCDIVKKCGGLPLAIKLIATTLKSQEKFVWTNALDRLKKNDLDKNVQEIIEISFKNLQGEEDREILLLCGLFPEDFNIPIEDLTRYAWGLRLLKEVSTLREARNRTKTCVSNLKNANLLIDCDSDSSGCVKMHDLVLSFVVATVSKGEDAWIIDHGDMSKWNQGKISQSCKRISLTWKGRSEFPSDFKFPNLSFLKVMQGKELRFPDNFYGEMERIQVLAYEDIYYPLLPASFQCSINLYTLCIHDCLLRSDCSSIGNLLNLEVLSITNCGTIKLPSSIGNLKKLRLLDLTDSVSLIIDDDVLSNLVKLEELYARTYYRNKDICNQLKEFSKNLFALEVELFRNYCQLDNISFEKLERFKISVECELNKKEKDMHLYENTLMLVTNIDELLESRLNVLFEKTQVLHLKIDGINNLEDIEVKSLDPGPQYSSFYGLRELVISDCLELGFLFTLNVATSLSKLEHLEIKSCSNMEELVHIEGNVTQKITFPKLKLLKFRGLPKLLGLSNKVNTVIELPQLQEVLLFGLPNFTSVYPNNKLATSSTSSSIISAMQPFFSEEVFIPKLEILSIYYMENLKEIWPSQFISSSEEVVNVSTLREITVRECHGIVNLFPRNPMSFLCHLEEIRVFKCDSIEVLFNIYMDCVDEIEKSSRLRSISISGLKNLTEICSVKGVNNSHTVISVFEAVTTINIDNCERFRNLFSPITSNFDMQSLTRISINRCGESWTNNEPVKSNQEKEINEAISKVSGNIHNLAFPSHLIRNFYRLESIQLTSLNGVEVVFEIESSSSPNTQQPQLLPHLKDIVLWYMERMTHVWRCNNWNEQQSFQNLTTINLRRCGSINYLFSPLMAKLLSNLREVDLVHCYGIEEVVSNRDDVVMTLTSTHKSTTLFPRLNSLTLNSLKNLKQIGGGTIATKDGSNYVSSCNTTSTASSSNQIKFSQAGIIYWSLCQYSREIKITGCDILSSVIPSYAVGQMHKIMVLEILECESMREIFETQGMNNSDGNIANVDERSGGTDTTPATPRPKITNVPKLFNLKKVCIKHCNLLQHVFVFSTLESLGKLEELRITACKTIKVIVKQEKGEQTTSKVVVFPRLKKIELINLPNLEGFFLGMNDFQWPALDDIMITDCPQMALLTPGRSTAPKLGSKYERLNLG